MRRWEALADGYIAEFRRRGLSEDHIKETGRELDRWGSWLRRRRPRPKLEEGIRPVICILSGVGA